MGWCLFILWAGKGVSCMDTENRDSKASRGKLWGRRRGDWDRNLLTVRRWGMWKLRLN